MMSTHWFGWKPVIFFPFAFGEQPVELGAGFRAAVVIDDGRGVFAGVIGTGFADVVAQQSGVETGPWVGAEDGITGLHRTR